LSAMKISRMFIFLFVVFVLCAVTTSISVGKNVTEEKQGSVTSSQFGIFSTLRKVISNIFRRPSPPQQPTSEPQNQQPVNPLAPPSAPPPSPSSPSEINPGSISFFPVPVENYYESPAATNDQNVEPTVQLPAQHPIVQQQVDSEQTVDPLEQVEQPPQTQLNDSKPASHSTLLDLLTSQIEKPSLSSHSQVAQQSVQAAHLINSDTEQFSVSQILQQLQQLQQQLVDGNKVASVPSVILPTTKITTMYITETVVVLKDHRYCKYYPRNTCNPTLNIIAPTRIPVINPLSPPVDYDY